MKILITGCNGLIACRLSKKLIEHGHTVVGISENGLTNPYLTSAHYLQVDICHKAKIADALDFVIPDVVIHCAAITKPDVCEQNPERCHQVNDKAAVHLISEVVKRNIYTVHLSTDFVFSGMHATYAEDAVDFSPVNEYGKTKYAAEKFIAAHFPQVAIVRTALVYGYEPLLPRSNVFTWAVDQLRKGNEICVVDDQFRVPTFADDLADGLFELCHRKEGGIFHLTGKDFMSVYRFVCQVAATFGLPQSLIKPVKTVTLNEPAKRPPSTFLRIDKAERLLQYRPHSVAHNLNILREIY